MPIINNPIQLSEQTVSLIAAKKLLSDFSHLNWGDEDLLPLRQEIREYYRNEQRLICVYCLNPISAISAQGAHIEHIVSKSLYEQFMFLPKNLCVICPDCNQCKSDNEALGTIPNPLKRSRVTQYPRVSNAFKIVHPHFDNYEDHIIKANRIYIDKTTKGHWTIGACKLNRFYHRFGVCDELIDDANSIKLEEKFHDAHASPDAVSNVMSDIEQSL